MTAVFILTFTSMYGVMNVTITRVRASPVIVNDSRDIFIYDLVRQLIEIKT